MDQVFLCALNEKEGGKEEEEKEVEEKGQEKESKIEKQDKKLEKIEISSLSLLTKYVHNSDLFITEGVIPLLFG